MQHKHRFQLSSSLRPKRALVYLGGVSLLALSTMSAHADPTLSELAAELRELKASNAQMRAENRQMKAAISEMRGTRVRTRESNRAVVERTVPASAEMASPGSVPVMVTADKKLRFGAITITPGGFLAAESVFRSRTTQSDISTQYNAIPFGPQAGTNEYRFTARQSRAALLVEGAVTPSVVVAGYGEFDFLGSGVTSNENESNSFVPRIRNLYGTIDLSDYGVHMLAGQSWSLATLNSKGITPRNEVPPPTIDGQFVPGFVWKRQPQIRLTKDFGQKLWLSLAAEEAQDVYTGCNAGVNGTTGIPTTVNGNATNVVNSGVTCDLLGTNQLNGVTTLTNVAGTNYAGVTNATAFSLNHVPDVIGKVAYEAKLGDRDIHLEGFGMYRDLYDRVAQTNTLTNIATATNHDTTGYGVGGSVIVPVLPRRLDFQASVLSGKGIGTYGTTQFTDATFSPSGALSPIRETMLMGGLTAHVTPAIDIYAFGGEEVAQPNYFNTNAPGTPFAGYGYGQPNANNTGCYNTIIATTTTGTSCAGNNKRIWQLTGGMWDKLYKARSARSASACSIPTRSVSSLQATASPRPTPARSPSRRSKTKTSS